MKSNPSLKQFVSFAAFLLAVVVALSTSLATPNSHEPEKPVSARKERSAKTTRSQIAPVRTTFQTQTRDFVLYQAQSNGKTQPKFVVRADYLRYPEGLSYRQLVPEGFARTPEEVSALFAASVFDSEVNVKRYQSLSIKPEMTDKEAQERLASLRKHAPDIADQIFLTRTDVANDSYLRAKVIYKPSAKKLLPFALYTAVQVGDRAYQSENFILDLGSPVSAAVRIVDEKAISDHPVTDWQLPYKLQLTNASSGPPDYTPLPPPALHPIFVLFDGKPTNVLLKDLKADDPDPILRFLHKVWRFSYEGTEKEWVKVWTDADAKKLAEKDDFLYDQIRRGFKNPYIRLYFVMDLGPVVSVFLENRLTDDKQSELERFDFFKQGDEYRLANFAFLPDGKQTFSSDLAVILNSPTFETFLRGIAKETSDPKAKLVGLNKWIEQLPIPGAEETPPKTAP